jgi:predicted aspartyl protease
MNNLLVFFLMSLFAVNSSHVKQTQFGKKKKTPAISAYPDPVPEGSISKLTLPMKRAGNLLLIELTVDDQQGNFILDTGAPHLVLNKTYFRNYQSYGAVFASGITGTTGQGDQIRIEQLDMGGISFRSVDADRINLNHLEEKKGIKILGLLGLNLFKYLELQINLAEGTVTLYRINKKGLPIELDSLHVQGARHVLDMENEQGLLILNSKIKNKNVRFYLDTGAESCVLHSGANKKVFESFDVKNTRKLYGAGGKTLEVVSGYLNNIEIGSIRLRRIPVTVANLNGLSGVYQTRIDGMLGYEFLAAGIVSINQYTNQIMIW